MPTSNADTTSSPPTHDTGKTIEPTATSDPASSALAQKWPRLFETILRLMHSDRSSKGQRRNWTRGKDWMVGRALVRARVR